MIGIVITAYNRAESLKNLLQSLSKLRLHPQIDKITLVISIDNKGTEEVNRVANEFNWHYGEKKVIIHSEKKGLVKHFIWAGDQTEIFDQVIFLEDDLYVSPTLLYFVKPLIDYYIDKDEIAAASLYNPVLIEATGTKFYQLEDGNDVFFIQHPYWGNVWFRNKWRIFKEFLATYTQADNSVLPTHIAAWDRSFKKIYVEFLIKTHKTVVYPRISLVTNNGDAGIHSGALYEYQSNIQLGMPQYKFTVPSLSFSNYDAYFELYSSIIKKMNPCLERYDFETDINGIRHTITKEFVLTSRPCEKAILSFTSLMKPTELGVILDIRGNQRIVLCRTQDLIYTSQKYYRQRRYLDIRKNYHIGILASFQITKLFFRETSRQIWKRLWKG
ncbi:MAG: glycosyltransferase [Bacteroides sp.]|nr:glycosyltransferase [Bacteroides sp.]